MITQDKLNKLHQLDLEDVKQILYECIEVLGVVSVPVAMKILCVNRSRVYQLMSDSNTLTIDKHKFLMINKLLNENQT